MSVQTGAADLIIAGGAESMSQAETTRWACAGASAAPTPR